MPQFVHMAETVMRDAIRLNAPGQIFAHTGQLHELNVICLVQIQRWRKESIGFERRRPAAPALCRPGVPTEQRQRQQ